MAALTAASATMSARGTMTFFMADFASPESGSSRATINARSRALTKLFQSRSVPLANLAPHIADMRDISYSRKENETMTREAIETAVREGVPFVVNMADGRQYEVRSQFDIAIGKTNAVVLDERSLPHVLPLLTMTGISYLPKPDDAA